MKLSLAFFLLISLVLFVDVSHGSRKDQGKYWKKMMKNEEIPEMLKELLFDDSMVENQKQRFMNNFDPHPNAIIYHAHAHAHGHGAATPTRNIDIKSNPTVANSAP
ncbi:organ-specific protein P4-like [Cucurbita moschata]|uniref:Organ-specific protein P4-like n=1 Tax=Cucurbita moschata TaxID=3662 RepID=A0A6J1FYV4_CUCMO|nr:organ-specific protein P4-like [Cucurbita moschata]